MRSTIVANSELRLAASSPLSPYDHLNGGRTVPILLTYQTIIEEQKFKDALREVLAVFPYARLGGRYEGGSSISFQQSGGVPLEVVEVDGEFSTLSYLFSSSAGPQIMKVVDHDQFTPSVKGSMDPDKFDPSQPLLAIRLTYYKDATVICLCAQHAAVDFGGMIKFLKALSDVYGGGELPESTTPQPTASTSSTSLPSLVSPKPHALLVTSTPGNAPQQPPPFARVAPRIMGDSVVVYPLAKTTLMAMKSIVSAAAPVGISTDDVVTALVWRALLKLRLHQLDDLDTEGLSTTLSRAWSFERGATAVEGAVCNSGNTVTQCCSVLLISELLAAPIATVATHLRNTLIARPTHFCEETAFLNVEREKGNVCKQTFDENALTFIVSSWRAWRWEDCCFEGTAPAQFDHGCNVGVVSVMVSDGGGGVNVYHSSSRENCEYFANAMDEEIVELTMEE